MAIASVGIWYRRVVAYESVDVCGRVFGLVDQCMLGSVHAHRPVLAQTRDDQHLGSQSSCSTLAATDLLDMHDIGVAVRDL